MSYIVKVQNLPFATDEECEELRQRFIHLGKIVPAGLEKILSCEEKNLASVLPKRHRNIADIPEEGTYRPRKIKSDEEYERRKRNYFIMLQEMLKSREELHLEFEDDE